MWYGHVQMLNEDRFPKQILIWTRLEEQEVEVGLGRVRLREYTAI